MTVEEMKVDDGHAEEFGGVKGWLTKAQADELAKIAYGKICLEIGGYCGRSAIVMAETAAMVYSLDWHFGDAVIGIGNDTLPVMRENVKRKQAETPICPVVMLVGTTGQMAGLLADRCVDVVYVDGAHDYESAKADFAVAKRILRDGGTIALHDWDRQSVQQAFRDVFGFSTGAERSVDNMLIVEGQPNPELPKGITIEQLQAEVKSLAMQEEQHRGSIAAAERVRKAAEDKLAAVGGANQMVSHLLQKLQGV